MYPEFESSVFKRNVDRAINDGMDISSTVSLISKYSWFWKENYELAELLSHSESTVGAEYFDLDGYFRQIKNKSACLPVHVNLQE